MKLKGRVINGGNAKGEAFVLDIPFSFIGDFDPETGKLCIQGHPLSGKTIAGKILVCPTGKGGTIAPFVAYQAWQKGNAPIGIICERAEPIICESAITINIPILDNLNENPVEIIRTGQLVSIIRDGVMLEEQ